MSVVSSERRGPVAVVLVDHPPVNAISQAVRAGIIDQVRAADADGAVTAIVLACKGRTFMAGADITEFATGPQPPQFPDVIAALEGAGKPVVAAIHGTAFGGGLELALACHYRMALPSARIGLPEVNIGIIPGAGGTQRLPRVAGVEAALDAIVTGRPVPAPAAHAAGAIDVLADGDLLDAAVAYAEKLAGDGAPLKKVRDIDIDPASLPDGFFDAYRKKMARYTRGFFAPERCIQAVEAAVDLPFDEGIARERDLIVECFKHPQARALQYAFFSERQAAQIPGLSKDTERRRIGKVGVIGAGTMGGGISMNFLNAGIPVTILEVEQAALDRGLGIIRSNYETTAKKGRLTAEDVERRLGLLASTLDYDALADCDLIIEAVFESMDIKKQVFAKLDAVAKPGAILATNTSYLNIDEIAAATSRPADVLGLHFFSPANVMRLLEIVRGDRTAPEVLATCMDMARKIGKVGVVAGVCHGFIGNRMLEGYGREASLLLLEGAAPEQIDKAIYDFGYPMGPLAMSDMAGLDIGYMLRQAFPADRFDPNAYQVANRLVEMGRKGQKTGAGYYRYEPGNRTPVPDPDVLTIIEETAAKLGIERRRITDEEIVERCILPLINEGAAILEEGIAYRASDIDVVYLYGYGFPRYRGGPMYHADSLGLANVADRIEHYRARQGDCWWTPAPLIQRLAGQGKGFADYRRDT